MSYFFAFLQQLQKAQHYLLIFWNHQVSVYRYLKEYFLHFPVCLFGFVFVLQLILYNLPYYLFLMLSLFVVLFLLAVLLLQNLHQNIICVDLIPYLGIFFFVLYFFHFFILSLSYQDSILKNYGNYPSITQVVPAYISYKFSIKSL